jgi:flagellar hook protein FlgE
MAFGSFSAGLSGLNANSLYLNVIGNNLANINTVGFKASTVSFQDMVSQQMGGTGANPIQVGRGTAVASAAPVFSQGNVESTREATNVAIQGDGFFVVRGTGGQGYTRAGNFSLNANGQLVTPDGGFVLGYTTINAAGNVVTTGAPSTMAIPPGVLRAPKATSSFQTVVNLDASAATGAVFTSTAQIYDVLGEAHTVSIAYTKTGANAWSYAMTVPNPVVPMALSAGAVTFVNGKATVPAADVVITPPAAWSNGAAATPFTWKVLDANGASVLTGYAAASATSSVSQDGGPAGSIDGISIGQDGVVTATFGGGQSAKIGQLVIATFNNTKGLVSAGSTRFVESAASGVANLGVAQSGGRGSLLGSALESSNVDIAQEFTQMILAQRGYQASAKTITVSDELLAETLNLKR